MAAPLDRDLLKESLQKIRTLRAELAARDRRTTEPIAIIGAGCRFPGGSENPDRYWQLLIEGRDAVRDVPRSRWDVDAHYDPDPDMPGRSYVRSGGFLDDIEGFDADFFGIAPREAVTLDPQQRLLLEVGWEALEHAGIAPDSLRGTSTGVYVGLMTPDYLLRQVHTLDVTDVDPYMLTGNDASFAAGRLSYVLGLQGPAMVISTACSSSLVSLHTACQALRAGECDLALAGGVNALIDPVTNIMLSRLRALSRDGRCRTFDAAADGYGRGEGCGLLVLARLSDARARGARILALVRGSAVNHDGPSAGLTVPNGSAQEKLLRRALAAAHVEPGDVSYVEAHGTGTSLGDPIELRALAAVLGTSRRQPLLVGSVKTNVGHLEAAAGVAATLKTALALRHGVIPPHLHFQTPNPHVPWNEIGIRVPVEATEWNGSPRIAGVSSFGLSGVNAHIVLEAPPVEEARAADGEVRRVLPISARSAEALEAQVARYEAWLDANRGACWADVCHTAATGRAHFAHRTVVVASSVREAREALRGAPRVHVASQDTATSAPLDAEALARAYLEGASIDWRAIDQDTSRRRPVDLPTYAFQRTQYWVLDSRPERAIRHAVRPAAGAEAERTAPDRRRLAASSLEAAIAEVLGLPSIEGRTDASLVELGLDSLMATELRGWIRDAMQVDVELPELLSPAAIETLVAAIRTRAACGGTSAAAPAEGARGSEIRFPLSAGQRALWFIHASAPDSPAYNVGMAFRLRSRIERHALTAALQMVIDRHPLLRARFRHNGDELVQEIDPRGTAVIDFVDASHWKIDEIQTRVLADYRRPFDLADGPAFRVSLYERDEGPVLLFALHHIICDATSCWTMLEDLRRALAAGSREGALPAASATYEHFVSWQSGMLAGAEGERSWSYWRERLGGELPVLALPLDRERPAAQRFNGASITCTVDRRLTGDLKALARAQGVTLHVLLLATFQALLHRLTGQDDSIVGSAALARPAGFEDVVGYFVNTLPIRVRAADDPAFTTFLAEVREAVLGAMAHQHFPFAVMVERLQPRRDPGRPPIVQADFAVTRPPTVYRGDALARTDGLALTPFDLAEEEGQFDIGLHVSDADAELVGTFKYNADLFEPSTIERIGRCWRALLASVTAHPERPLSALPLLSSDERARTLALGRGPDVPYESISFIEMFERQAARTPSATAVEGRTPSGAIQEVTYAELRADVDRLAARLGWLGVRRDVTVGVVLPRSAEVATALLAVMRAGGAYVPIDPSYPDARIEWMLADARVGAVVTTSALAARVKTPAPVVCVGAREAGLPQSDWRIDAPSPEDLAYVIYTSGSTGQPKGVAITHGGLTNYVSWALDAYDVANGCGAPVSSSIGFDATITSLLLPLAVGGRVIMLPEQEAMQALATVLAEGRDFSLVKITPAHLEVLAQLLPDTGCAGAARTLVIGGEALRGDMLARWQQHAAATRIFNEYGPTETVVGCCVHEVTEPARGAVPIGRPIANTQLYVLDRHMEPVPIGVVGELYIGGAGVARGYLHRPELTRERFVPDPFDPAGAGRLYRTGDLVRLRADGLFEFIGRIDDQVKLRGYRIEPAEIEAAIKEHGTVVAEAAVVVREDQPGHRQLVAYVVPSQGSCDVAALRRDLAARLPEFMRPSAVVVLDRLPLTANGKLDRGALPRPETASMRQRFTAPRDSTEMRLAALWEDLLDVRPIGVRDDFFDLGGHSLLAVRLMARVRDTFGADIALADVLRAPTIERLADRIRAGVTRQRSSLVPIQPSGSRRPFFCLPGAGGNTIYFYNLARQLGSDQPFYGLQGVGFDGEAPPHDSVEQMAAHAIGEVRARQPHGPYAIGGHSLGAWVAYEMVQRLVAEGEAVSLLALIDTPVPHPAAVRETSDWDQARWIVELADRIARLLDPSLSVSLEALRQLDEAAQVETFRAALHRTDLFPGEAGAAHLANALALFRAHSRVRYTARPAPESIAVTLLRTAAPPPHLAAVAGDPTWGWGTLARVDVHQLPGDHLAILRPPHVAALAAVLSAALERAEAAIGASCLQRSF